MPSIKTRVAYDRITLANVEGLVDTAQTAADAAQASADAAQSSAEGVETIAKLTGSGVTGVVINATDAGSDVSVTVSAHTRIYGDGSSVSVNSGSVTGLAYSTSYYIYYDQASFLGGAVTYLATTSDTTAAQVGSRHLVGQVTTPAALGADIPGDRVKPSGVGYI